METLNLSRTPAADIELPVMDIQGSDRVLAHAMLDLADNPIVVRLGSTVPSTDEMKGRAAMLCQVAQNQGASAVYVDSDNEAFHDILLTTMEDAGLIAFDSTFGTVVE